MPSLTLANSLRATVNYTPFTPTSLFSEGAQGAWYDPSDFTTLYQDAAGTTPVTAVEQPVGLMLDKSKGLVLGSELVTNGNFSNGTTGWTAGSGGAISADTTIFASGIKVTGGGAETTAGAQQVLSGFVVGKSYRISTSAYAAPENSTPNSATISLKAAPLATDSSSSAQVSASGVIQTLSFVFVATATSHTLYGFVLNRGIAWANTSSFAYFDNISVRELPGNHAFQTTAASRPVLSARYNLLTKTEDFSDASWQVASSGGGVTGIKTPNYGVAPDGTTTACRVQLDVSAGSAGAQSQMYKTYSTPTVATLAPSAWLRTTDGSTKTIKSFSATGGTETNITVTGTWTRLAGSRSSPGSSDNFQIVLIKGTTSDTADLLIWHPDSRVSNDGITQPAYQRVNTSTDYDTVGFKPYLLADGVDDGMVTNSIDFTATDKMTVCAGVRKLAIDGIVVELSASTSANNGAFLVYTPESAYRFDNKGTVQSIAAGGNGTVPITSVISGIGDISGDVATLRVNGAQAAASITDQGTGNYGNYPLYLFRRGGATLPFNGRFYGMTVVGKTVTAGELTALETYTNNKTGAY